MALSASVKPPIAFDAPVMISPSFMPAPAASKFEISFVASSMAGASSLSKPAANSMNLFFAVAILSSMRAKACADSCITSGIDPSRSLASPSSLEKFFRIGNSCPPAFPKILIASADASPSSPTACKRSASNSICWVGVLPAMSAMVRPRRPSTSLFFSLPWAASSMNFWSLLIVPPTLSAPTPVYSKAFCSTAKFATVSPVRVLRSSSSPPIANALPN